PHLGILSDYFEEAALEIFFQDCLKPLSLLVRPDYYFKIPGVKRTLAKVIINDKFEFELIESKRIFIRLGEKVRKIFIKPNLFVQFDNVVLEPLVDGYRCVCLDGTKLDQPLENFSF
ncbi:MAG: hypothetical protein NZO16_08100, partial [Deltaproteobacteria bacterium]|nr:hypothetical protein [Deltaproteobacteria bacterium]